MARATVADNAARLDLHSQRLVTIQDRQKKDGEVLDNIDHKLSGEFFTKVDKMYEGFTGNGKPGFFSIRDKVLAWEAKVNMISVAVIIDIIIRVAAWVGR